MWKMELHIYGIGRVLPRRDLTPFNAKSTQSLRIVAFFLKALSYSHLEMQ